MKLRKIGRKAKKPVGIKKNKNKVDKNKEHLIGTFISNKKGFGFVEVEGMTEDFFIPEKYTLNAFHNDFVRIAPLTDKRGKRSEAKIIKIISHGLTEVVGTYERTASFGFVRPDNPKVSRDIYIGAGMGMDAEDGDKVVVSITDYGSVNKGPAGRVTEVIGGANEKGVDVISIARAFGIEDAFPVEVIKESNALNNKVTKRQTGKRLDLTKDLIISIDGDDSKDLDDAISLKKKGDFFYLGVHIADVSHYVKEGSAIDMEAYKRSTSVYLLDKVIPMLPESLSNGICSLLQDELRLTLSCIMKIDKKGNVVASKIAESAIINKRRMTYKNVNKILANPKGEEAKKDKDVVPMLLLMEKLAKILAKKRERLGAIEFDTPESKFILDGKGLPIEVYAPERGVSERMIEEFMVLANETVAKTYYSKKIPFLYRSHPVPEAERIDDLKRLCELFGITLQRGKREIKPKDIQKVIKAGKGKDFEILLSTVSLRCMQQAKYSDVDSSHFGLALEYYCHFTSPIRRYPDLLIHRIIKQDLTKPLSVRKQKHYAAIMPMAAEQTSRLERRAVECEREVDKLKKCEYMYRRVGEEFDGFISGVTGWGMYVTLPNTVEGMVPIHTITGDRFIYDEKGYCLLGERTGKKYVLGSAVKVKVDKVDLMAKTIDFKVI